MMTPLKQSNKIYHSFLVRADDSQRAVKQVELYLSRTQMVSYKEMTIAEDDVLSGQLPGFESLLKEGVAGNMAFAAKQLALLKDEGVTQLDDLLTMEEGYLTKVLHIVTHVLDGVIGIDSAFYNLVEDSHRISPALFTEIQTTPEHFWLVKANAVGVQDSILHFS